MVSVFGDLRPQDDSTHAPGPEANYNESAYYNFFARGHQSGGFIRIGNRVNEGYAEMTLCLYLPGGEALFNWKRPEISSNNAFNAGGMRFEVLEPFLRHHTVYEGSAVYLKDPTQMADPSQAFRQNPHKQVKLDLLQEAVGPVYGATGSRREIVDPEREFARAHFEQHMRVRGTLSIDGETLEIDALGLRDHSWGPRYWQVIPYYRWLTCTFSPDFGIMVLESAQADGPVTQQGVVVRGLDHLERARRVELRSEFDPGSRYHRAMTATLELENGQELEISGAVSGFVPLRNRRAGHLTYIGEGMTEYRCGDHIGYGISEYLDQIE